MPRPDFSTPRLFVDADLAPDGEVTLRRDQANYLVNVLRLGANDRVLVFNGRDGEWRADLVSVGKRDVRLLLSEQTRPQPVASPLTYAFAPLKHARLDYLVQKAVEMGAGVLQPVLTRRTQVSRINTDRMRANVVEAAEQCGVLAVPEVRLEERFEAWLAAWPDESPLVFCDEDAETGGPLATLDALPRFDRIGLVIGPEGGFDPGERAALSARANVLRVSLGPRILRADTAAVAALAIIQASVGDWR